MRGLLVVGAAVAAVLVPAAPASTVDGGGEVARVVAPPRPAPTELFRAPDEGCTVPVGSSIQPCPPGGRRRPPVSCVLPVNLSPGTTLVTPRCAHPRPGPEGRVVPLTR